MNREDSAVEHTVKLSSDFDQRDGLGVIPVPGTATDVKRDQIETKGLKWNIGTQTEL